MDCPVCGTVWIGKDSLRDAVNRGAPINECCAKLVEKTTVRAAAKKAATKKVAKKAATKKAATKKR